MNCRECRTERVLRPAIAKGLCTKHYQRMKTHGTLDDLSMKALPNGYCSKRDDQGRKICSTCRNWLPESSFGPAKEARDGLRPVCKICRRIAQLRVSRVLKHGCERVTLKGMNTQGEIVEYAFDSPEVELIEEGKPPRSIRAVERKTGGPHDRAPMRRR